MLLLGVERADLTVAGVLFALLAGAAWAAYILLSAQTGRRWQGFDGLAMASVVATVLLVPLLLAAGGTPSLDDRRILLLGALVGLLSSVIPYSCELVALRALRPAVFGILMSLEPAAAALAGLVVLGELLSPVQLVAMACVVVASVGATRRGAHRGAGPDWAGRVHAFVHVAGGCGRRSSGLALGGHHVLPTQPASPPALRESQQVARRNAMIASTALAQRRAERQDVADYFADRTSGQATPTARAPRRAALAGPTVASGTIARMPTSAARAATASALAFHDILSDDGTHLRAWTNDPDRLIDGPTVVLCNGLGTNAFAWPALLRPECGVRVVSWNHRGTGGSDRPRDPSHVEIGHFVEDALSVMDHFGIDRAVLMGWSMGVNTMFELAFRHPERVTGLFAVGGVPGDTFRTMLAPAPTAARLPGPSRSTSPEPSSSVAGRSRRSPPDCPIGPRAIDLLTHAGFMLPVRDPELAAVAVKEFLQTPIEWYMHLALCTSRHARVRLSKVTVPAMFVAGKHDLLAGSRDMASGRADRRRRLRRARRHPLRPDGAARAGARAAARLPRAVG